MKERFLKHKYLLQLTATCVCLMLIPSFIILLLLFNSSYNQMLNANAESSAEGLRRFSAQFQAAVSSIQQSAYKLALATSDLNESLSLLASLQPDSNNYYYAEGARLLNGYSTTSGRYLALYYQDDDVLLDTAYRFTSDTYIRYAYRDLTPEKEAALRDFLQGKGGAFFSDGDKMLVGFPVQLGSAHRGALVFSQLHGSDFKLPQLAYENAQTDYAVYDAEGDLMLTTAGTFGAMESLAQEGEGLKRTDDGYTANYSQKDGSGLTYIMSIQLDGSTSSMIRFFTYIRSLFGVAAFLLLALTAAVIYLNYRPISLLMSKIRDVRTGDEITDISRYVERLNSEMSDQNLRLMDYLLGNLLRGAPVPMGELERMGLTRHVGYFCVMTLFYRSVNTQLRVELTQLLQKDYGVKVFITDILGRDQVVFILLLPTPEIDSIERFIRGWLSTHLAYPLTMRMGPVMSSINGICSSYQACLPAEDLDARKAEESSQTQILQLKDEILKYLQENYTDPNLSQIAVADAFGISTYSLSRLFKKHVGVGFSEYITGMRLEAAKNLLAHTEKSIAEIASEVGISSANYFSRLFKTNVGVSPLRYREDEQGKRLDSWGTF